MVSFHATHKHSTTTGAMPSPRWACWSSARERCVLRAKRPSPRVGVYLARRTCATSFNTLGFVSREWISWVPLLALARQCGSTRIGQANRGTLKNRADRALAEILKDYNDLVPRDEPNAAFADDAGRCHHARKKGCPHVFSPIAGAHGCHPAITRVAQNRTSGTASGREPI